ncbi:MAG: STAS domain-containing protein [Oscillospiraceae bacterium]|jgi:anti-anti-sigma factor|nr:STAS domain-containing protein [Oscillospiraceae bacterium]
MKTVLDISRDKEDKYTVLSVSGRVDTMTSPELQNVILAEFREDKFLILDLSGVEYVSSAGLRALLIGHKTAVSKDGEMILRGVNPGVMSVLDSVGFTAILTIRSS